MKLPFRRTPEERIYDALGAISSDRPAPQKQVLDRLERVRRMVDDEIQMVHDVREGRS